MAKIISNSNNTRPGRTTQGKSSWYCLNFFNSTSVFSNQVSELIWDNPFRATNAAGGSYKGRLALYPDNSMLLELSTKCATSEAFQTAAGLRAFLTHHEIDLSGDQETKTKKALEFFSQQLQAV